jgi:hypothetical protein
LAVIGPEKIDLSVRQPDVVTAIPWTELFAMSERCDHLEGALGEDIFTTLCQAARKQVREPPPDSPGRLSFPVNERVFEALRQARAEFQRQLDADPELAGTVWHCEGSRGEDEDHIYGWFLPEVGRFRGRALSVRARSSKDDPSVRIEVRASRNYLANDTGWTARHEQLTEQAKSLSWRPAERRDKRGDREVRISHHFAVTDLSWPPRIGDKTVSELVAEGLLAYARAFRAFLSHAE